MSITPFSRIRKNRERPYVFRSLFRPHQGTVAAGFDIASPL